MRFYYVLYSMPKNQQNLPIQQTEDRSVKSFGYNQDKQSQSKISHSGEDKTNPNLFARPPVVVVMGHIDHGKTSLLDYIRKTKVAAREAGGITQHLGAYEIEHQGKRITFIDTPGHEAFATIRQRGAHVADIALLVIAADEGLKPQSIEALNFIKQEKLPFIVVLNKIDRPGANPDKIRQELSEHEVFVEQWGGKVPSIETSAITGQGIDELLEIITLLGEIEELKSDPTLPAEGVVLESAIDARRGIVTTLLVLNGTLNVGDIIHTSTASAKVKLIENFLGKRVKQIGASSPCLIIGWEQQPLVGEHFSEEPQKKSIVPLPTQPAEITTQQTNTKTSNFILKADVSGSLEALALMCTKLFEELGITYRFINQSIGDISLNDLKLAETSNAMIIAFNSKLDAEAKHYFKPEKIMLIQGNIIYRLLEELRTHLEKVTNPNYENIIAKLTVLAVFSGRDKKNRQLIGGQLFEGKIKPGIKFNIVRNEEKIGTGKVLSIKKNKEEIKEAESPVECGIRVELTSPDVVIQEKDRIDFKNDR